MSIFLFFIKLLFTLPLFTSSHYWHSLLSVSYQIPLETPLHRKPASWLPSCSSSKRLYSTCKVCFPYNPRIRLRRILYLPNCLNSLPFFFFFRPTPLSPHSLPHTSPYIYTHKILYLLPSPLIVSRITGNITESEMKLIWPIVKSWKLVLILLEQIHVSVKHKTVLSID